MASKNSRVRRIDATLDELLLGVSKKNGIKYSEASKLAAKMLMQERFKKNRNIEIIRRIEF
jgi:hypothetical protein